MAKKLKDGSPLRVALYARVSTESQEEEGQSLSTQIAMMRDAVGKLGAVVARVYQYQESAMPGRDRPSLTEMLRDAAGGQFDAVMVCKMDRLSRSIEVLTHVENSLRTFGIQLFEGFDEHNLRSAEGRLNRGMQALIGEYSVNRLKWSACASRLERAKRGWPHSGLLPYGRKVVEIKDRRNAMAEWALDGAKAKIVATMYEMYIERDMNFAQVGKRLSMNPETVRRILVEQSGPEWKRNFVDPATGERVEVITSIPPLLTERQRAELLVRTKQNQMQRAAWGKNGREYPLSGYLRCANPLCNWSNLTGHQSTFEVLEARSNRKPAKQKYSYYNHMLRSRAEGCFPSIPADAVEDEIFARLGHLLKDAKALTAAVRDAVINDPVEIQELKLEHTRLTAQRDKAKKVLANALEVLFEQKGTAAAAFAQNKVNEQNKLIAEVERRLEEVASALRTVDLPRGFEKRMESAMAQLVGLNGGIAMHWPTKAKRALLALFFGSRSTRFDRIGKHQHSDQRGIFLTKVSPDGEAPYWRYEARGLLGDFTGALTRVVETYESEATESMKYEPGPDQLREMAELATTLEGLVSFRLPPDAGRHWSGSRCRGTSLPWPANGSAHPGRVPQIPRGPGPPGAIAGSP